MTALSIGIFVIMSGWLQTDYQRYSEISNFLNEFGDLAESDIQTILQEDVTKYGTAYQYMNDLYILNDLFQTMELYNATHPFNYTQQDFDEVAMEFTSKLRLLIATVESTTVWEYSRDQLKATVANNYTYKGGDYFFIINKWYQTNEPHEDLDVLIKNYVNISFSQSGDAVELPEIRLDKWTYHLYNNLSILETLHISTSIGYFEMHSGDVSLTLVNLSLMEVAAISDGYYSLSGRAAGVIQDFNNTLITLALAGVLMGFSASFDNKNYRRITMIIGLILLVLSVVYFMSTFGTLSSMAYQEATLALAPDFVTF
jgi:hypothetical protein